MLKIRLQRIGRKNEAQFRLVVTDSKNGPQSGKFKEVLGYYTVKSDKVELDGDRVKHWIAMGAQVSATVTNLLISKGVLEGRKINVLPKKSPTKSREEVKKETKAKKK